MRPIIDVADLCPPLVLIEWLASASPCHAGRGSKKSSRGAPAFAFRWQDNATAEVLAPNLGASDSSGDWDHTQYFGFGSYPLTFEASREGPPTLEPR